MGIGSVRMPENGAAVRQGKAAGRNPAVSQGGAAGQKAGSPQADVVSKRIQNEISELQRQKQGLSSKREMSAEERSKKERELQQELSGLNARLRQRQAEVYRKQKTESRLSELSDPETDAQKGFVEGKGAKEEDAEEKTKASVTANLKGVDGKDEGLEDFEIPQDSVRTVIAGSFSREQTNRREAVIARTEGGIAILKGEIRQDEIRGNDTEKKKAELKAREARVKNAANGLPAVSVPFQTTDAASRGAGRIKAGDDDLVTAGIVKRSPDGVVVIT